MFFNLFTGTVIEIVCSGHKYSRFSAELGTFQYNHKNNL